MKKIVVIPAYKPCNKLLTLLNELETVGFTDVIVVDDGSSEECKEIFAKVSELFSDFKKKGKLNGVILQHGANLGKGRAIKTAFNHILNIYGENVAVITADADGQHKIKDIVKIKEALDESQDKIVLGCRCFSSTESQKIPLRSKFGNICTKIVLRYLCNIHISDTQTGLRGIPGKYLKELVKVSGERYEYETNVLLKATELEIELQEVPIETIYENNNETSHFNPLRDSIKIYMTIIKYSMASIMSVIIDNSVFILGGLYTDNVWILTFLGRSLSAVFNFLLNKQVVFKKKGNVKKQILKYLTLLVFSGTISAIGIQLISSIVPINIVLIKLFVESILFFMNFYIQKNVVFGRD